MERLKSFEFDIEKLIWRKENCLGLKSLSVNFSDVSPYTNILQLFLMYLASRNMAYMLFFGFGLFEGDVVTQRTTDEIRTLLSNAKLDFESVENEALNAYLSRIFHSCPFTEDICTREQCMDCPVFKDSKNR